MLHEHVKSFTEVKLSYICCCSPDPQGSLHCHSRKLVWLDVICSWEIEAGCDLSSCYFLGVKRQIAWTFVRRFFWTLKSSWFVPNSPDSPFFLLFFRRMMYLLGDNSFALLPECTVQMTRGLLCSAEGPAFPMGCGRRRADHHIKI